MAQQNEPNKPIHLMFLASWVLLFFLLKWTADWIVGYFVQVPSQFYLTTFAFIGATAVAAYFYRREKTYLAADEVANEMKKVTWPNAKEVKAATMVVVVMSLVASAILSVYDAVFSQLTKLFYG